MSSKKAASQIVCVFSLFHCLAYGALAEQADKTPQQATVEASTTVEGPSEQTWASETLSRSEHLYPSVWGQVGIFRVRSAYALPEGALTFGIGGELYSVGDAPDVTGLGPTAATTIAESLFVGYSPLDKLTFFLMRRNSSTTFSAPGQSAQLISSLGDFTLGGSYTFELGSSLSVSPIANFMVASNFNNLAPSGSTLSGGFGAAATLSLYSTTRLPLFLHANLIYHSPQIRGASLAGLQPEIFFQFSRFNTVTMGLGAEIHVGDFIPFVEYHNTGELGASIGLLASPSKITVGTRYMPLSNKSLAILAGVDIGTGRAVAAGVPYTAPAQFVAQLSYTTGLASSERKHYFTTNDVRVVNRKFIIKKNINFKVGSAILEPSSTELLDQIADVILKNQVHKLLIVGHTDSSHKDDYNLKLSLDRAVTVKNYLVSKGIAEETLMTQGFGKRKPRASNTTEEGRAKNRRVEFFILE
jgi:outer membrane protein OmpA-like peptidoglycan-associated protein